MTFEQINDVSGTTPFAADARSKRWRTQEIAHALGEDPGLMGLQMNGLTQVPEPRLCLRLRATFVIIDVRATLPRNYGADQPHPVVLDE